MSDETTLPSEEEVVPTTPVVPTTESPSEEWKESTEAETPAAE